jgi:Leucine-rich repeat (LRR) protein
LQNNQISGSLPSTIGNLVLLENLKIFNNQISGSLPAEIGNLRELVEFLAQNNKISGLPNEMTKLAKVQVMRLNKNEITKVPSLAGMSNLIVLSLDSNRLTAFPDSLNLLPILINLTLDNNQITDAGMPTYEKNALNFPNISLIGIANNRLQFAPLEQNINIAPYFVYAPQAVVKRDSVSLLEGESFSFTVTVSGTKNRYQWLKNGATIPNANQATFGIESVNLSDEAVYTCEITNEIANALTLRAIFKVQVSPLPQIPANLGDSLALVALYNSTDGKNWTKSWDLTKPVYTWQGVYVFNKRVVNLALLDNNLKGTLPEELGNLAKLEELLLGNDEISGTIPTSIVKLENLQYLVITNARLSGSIPDDIGKMTNLQTIELNDNQLTGNLPASIEKLTSLTSLYLDNNQLSGEIPAGLNNVPLIYFAANNNRFSGSLAFLAKEGVLQEKISILQLSNNSISGAIPEQIGQCRELINLVLYNNQLSGNLPASIVNMGNGRKDDLVIALQNNRLSGTIPAGFGKRTFEYFDLSGNLFSGELPADLGDASITILNLSNNRLTGSIPASFGNIKKLRELYLNDNLLSGRVPENLASLVSVERINLNNNQLTDLGTLRDPNGLRVLQELDVRNNRLQFEPLERNQHFIGRTDFRYAPQQNFLPDTALQLAEGAMIVLNADASISGTRNEYRWYKDNVLIPGANALTLTLKNDNNSVKGIYTFEAVNTIVTKIDAPTRNLFFRRTFTINLQAAPPRLLSRPSDYCIGTTTVTLRADADRADSIVWFKDATLKQRIGNGRTINVNIQNDRDTLYFVAMVGTVRSIAEKVVIQVRPTISRNGNVLTATSGGDAYQWLRYGEPILGATQPTFTLKEAGIYTVRINKGDCSATSTAFIFDPVGVADDLMAENIQLYPNPAQSQTVIMFKGRYIGKLSIRLFDALGRELHHFDTQKWGEEIMIETDLTPLAQGVYTVEIATPQGRVVKKLIKE